MVQRLTPEQRIDQLVDGAISKGLIAGGVVLIGSPTGTLFANGVECRVTAVHPSC